MSTLYMYAKKVYLPGRGTFARMLAGNSTLIWSTSQFAFEMIRAATEADPATKPVKQTILNRSPYKRIHLPHPAHINFVTRGKLAIYDGIVSHGERVVVHAPCSQGSIPKKRTPPSHPWIYGCLFWPNI